MHWVVRPHGSADLVIRLATRADEPDLRAFGGAADMPGAIRFAFERTPDYFEALRVEGRTSEVFVCRKGSDARLVAAGHRSVKTAFVNGRPGVIGYLGGLRLDPSVRRRTLLARGYAYLRERHQDGRAAFYLTTIMEDNLPARAILESGRGGLPRYVGFGRFCCMALGLRAGQGAEPPDGIAMRSATPADAAMVVDFLEREGRRRQFFPQYSQTDFGAPGGLLADLQWSDVLLAVRGDTLVGTLASWDQRQLRRWRVTGYTPWLRRLRPAVNLMARLRRMPRLPPPGEPVECLVLSLPCVAGDDRRVFAALVDESLRRGVGRCALVLAGLHEHDPLLPVLQVRPHVALPSRLYAVAWEDGMPAVELLDRRRVPYLELGAL